MINRLSISSRLFFLVIILYLLFPNVSIAATGGPAAPADDLLDLSATQTNSDMETTASSVDIGDLNRIQEAFNVSKEFQNTLIYKYNPLSTYKIRLRTSMDSLLILPEKEVITIYNFGDDVNFSFSPLKDGTGINTNMGIIKNLNSGADTNLIIIGKSGNSYNFYLRTDDHSSTFLPHLKVFIEDPNIARKLESEKSIQVSVAGAGDSPKSTMSGSAVTSYREGMDISDYLRTIDNTPMRLLHLNQNLDFRYVIFKKGNVMSPKAVFDDGYWTYFRLSTDDNLDKVAELPVVLKVVNGIEQPVNTRVVNNYVIAETTGSIFALRVDDRVLCIEKRIEHEKRFLK